MLLDKDLRDTFADRTLTEDEEAFLKALSPGHILAFATWSSKVPAVGFHPTPKITFIHEESKHLPIAHTCANELQLFVNAKTMADDDDFNYCFLVALMNEWIFTQHHLNKCQSLVSSVLPYFNYTFCLLFV